MMAAGDFRDVTEFAGPGNLLQKADGMDHVSLNLKALFFIQRALTDGKHLDFIHGQDGPLLALNVFVMKIGDVQQSFEIPLRQHSGLVGPDNRFLVLAHLAELLGQTRLKILLRLREFLISVFQKEIYARFQAFVLQRAPDKTKTLLDDLKLRGIKFFGLDQHRSEEHTSELQSHSFISY